MEGRFEGSIPTEVGRLTALDFLAIQSTVPDCSHIVGDQIIPSELGLLSNLRVLVLVQLCLEGTFPSSILRLTNLAQLAIANNALSGSLPTEIGRLTRLVSLNINSNLISGTIPTEISMVPLTSIHLFRNRFSGNVPRLPFVPNMTAPFAACQISFGVAQGEQNCFASCPASQCYCGSDVCTVLVDVEPTATISGAIAAAPVATSAVVTSPMTIPSGIGDATPASEPTAVLLGSADNSIAIIAGSVCAGVMLAMMLVIVCLWRRSRQRKQTALTAADADVDTNAPRYSSSLGVLKDKPRPSHYESITKAELGAAKDNY